MKVFGIPKSLVYHDIKLQHNLYGCVDLLQKFMPTKTQTRKGHVKIHFVAICVFLTVVSGYQSGSQQPWVRGERKETDIPPVDCEYLALHRHVYIVISRVEMAWCDMMQCETLDKMSCDAILYYNYIFKNSHKHAICCKYMIYDLRGRNDS